MNRQEELCQALLSLTPEFDRQFSRPFFKLASDLIPPMHMRIMIHLLHEKRCTLSTLSQAINVSQPQLSVAVSTLYDRGFLIRTADTRDRRRVFLSLSEEGVTFLDNMQKTVVSHFAEQLSALSENEQLRFLEAVSTLREFLKKYKAKRKSPERELRIKVPDWLRNTKKIFLRFWIRDWNSCILQDNSETDIVFSVIKQR